MGSADSVQPCANAASFDNILNFRDVGETVNRYLGKKLMREGLLYRSARLDDASLEDRRRLRDEFGIRTVMDLRTKTEHLNASKKRQAELAFPPVGHAKSNPAAGEPLQVPGIAYLEISLTGRQFERHLLSQLSWWSFLKFLFLFVLGLRMRAIAILGREVMLPRGLAGLGIDTLDQCGPELCATSTRVAWKQALESLVDPSRLPLLVHCTQGKDRTGLVVILALLAAGAPADAAGFDYRLSDEGLLPEREARLAEIAEIGLPAEFGDTAADMVRRVAAHLEAAYDGGLVGYLDRIGFGAGKRERLRDVLAY